MRTPDNFRYVPLGLALLLVAAPSARGDNPASPFVSGFERFARHGQIEREVGGRLLLSELNCTACHGTSIKSLQPKLGPSLAGAGNRIQRDWLKRFLAAPQSVDPGTTMPDMLAQLAEDEKAKTIELLVAFLASQQMPFPEVKASGANPVPHEFWNRGDTNRGQQLYHQVGCVACHEPDESYQGGTQSTSSLDQLLKQLDPEEIEAMGLSAAARPVRSVPHGDLPRKYTQQSLTFFLLNPAATRTGGRMPSLKLNPVEAADIAAFLLRGQDVQRQAAAAPASEEIQLAMQAEGRQLFRRLQCANCHVVKETAARESAKPLAKLDFNASRTCFDATPARGLPHFPLDQHQSQSVKSALARLKLKTSPQVENVSAQQTVDFRFLQFNCFACHQRNELGGVGRERTRYFETVGHVDLGDEGRLPPPLTGVGGKLHLSWINKVLAGTGDIRPHMLARMPRFPPAAMADLPHLLEQADGSEQPTEADVFGDPSGLAASGRTLLDAGCVQCHLTRGESPPGVVGVDLAGVADRVYPQWFYNFLLNPELLKTGTRMPTFFPGGKSSIPNVLEGDVDRQIAAIWSYLKHIDQQPLPEKVVHARSQAFELIPKQRTLVLRTFMQQAGTHAIAVGFPAKVHIAFDAENVRLSQAWRGRFIDAYGTWFVRFAPPATPLGADLIVMPAGVPLAFLEDLQQPWPMGKSEDIGYQFLGYRLDRSGTPTFLYRLGEFDIEDRITPSEDNGLKRRLDITNRQPERQPAKSLWFRIHVGRSLRRDKPLSYANDDGLTVIISEAADRLATLRKLDGQAEWILPVELDGPSRLEVEYRW